MKDYQKIEIERAVVNLNTDGIYRLARFLHHALLAAQDPTSHRLDELVQSASQVAGDINKHYRLEAGER